MLPDSLSGVAELTESGCWRWLGYVDPNGYGRKNLRKHEGGGYVYAHRWSYEQMVGPIPEGLTIDHLCRNRGCVNPEHLEPVTRGENVLRGEGPAAQAARKTHCPKGHAYEGENLYVNPNTGHRMCVTCQRNDENRAERNARVQDWRRRNPEKVRAQQERAYAKRLAIAGEGL